MNYPEIVCDQCGLRTDFGKRGFHRMFIAWNARAESAELARLRAENDRLRAEIAAEDAAHAWVQDAPQPEAMCNYPSCADEGCPCQYWREPQ